MRKKFADREEEVLEEVVRDVLDHDDPLEVVSDKLARKLRITQDQAKLLITRALIDRDTAPYKEK